MEHGTWNMEHGTWNIAEQRIIMMKKHQQFGSGDAETT